MRSHRTKARGVLAAALLAVGASASPAAAAPPGDRPANDGPPGGFDSRIRKAAPAPAPPAPSIIFPVVGPSTYTNDYGDARPQGPHAGIDIVAEKRQLAVAAEAGKVKFWTTSSAAGCMLYLYGRGGTTYLYIHLNNDLTAKNDNRGKCVAGVSYVKGLKSGTNVAAGQPVGYVGDSGDADGIHPHLHFEVHPRGGRDVNPFPYLNRARRLLFAANPDALVSLSLNGTLVAAPREQLDLRVNSLRVSTGLRVAKVGRTVRLALPPSTLFEWKGGIPIANAELPSLQKGQPLTAWTVPDWVTLDAQLGKPGVLETAKVALEP